MNNLLQRKIQAAKSSKYKNIWELKDSYKNEDIYVLGSGKTLEFFPKNFFADKVVIALNYTYLKVIPDFVVSVHREAANDAIKSGFKAVCAQYEAQCVDTNLKLDKKVFIFKHSLYHNTEDINFINFNKEGYCLSGASSVIPAMDIARILGAKNIILCGVDCGIINEDSNIDNYKGKAVYTGGFFEKVEKQIEKVANTFREEGIGVFSINPFVTLGLEGNKYSKKEKKNDKPNIFNGFGLFNRR